MLKCLSLSYLTSKGPLSSYGISIYTRSRPRGGMAAANDQGWDAGLSTWR